MSPLPELPGWHQPALAENLQIRKYSTTGDILSYKRCRRQYGMFSVRGWASSSNTQRYFGTLVHDVIDRINRDYQVNPVLPDLDKVTALVEEAHDRLARSGIRALNASQNKASACKAIYRLVRLVGPAFFPNVRETEYRLEQALETTSEKQRYILGGVVDVVSGAVMHALGAPTDTAPDDIEIWDYKSGKLPRRDGDRQHPYLQDYIYQMRVYARLYEMQAGYLPARCVLVFTGALNDDSRWNEADPIFTDYPDLLFTVNPKVPLIEEAMERFHSTVEAIERERQLPYHQQWLAPEPGSVDEQTCVACDLRYNCSGYPAGSRLVRAL